MPKRGTQSDDNSPGDGRQPYSDIGGTQARHAYTHNVRQEALTNPQGPDRSDEEFAADIAPSTASQGPHSDIAETTPASQDKVLHERLPDLTNDELARIPVIEPGVALEQGGVYLDLNDRQTGPFKALASQTADRRHRYVAKKDVAYELWNQLTRENDEVTIERPT